MSSGRRVERLPSCPWEAGQPVELHFEGRTIEGREGEPLAVTLLAAGVQVFGRSIKYHRPRGPVCMQGHCSGCLMRVDGVPNVRTCERPCRAGMVVERQGGWPGSKRDVFRAIDWLAPDTLDHHGMFTASAAVNRMAARVIRRFSGIGELPAADPPRPECFHTIQAPVVVVGAGVAGMAAAGALASRGHPVVLFERDAMPGGRLLDGACRITDAGDVTSGWDALAGSRRALESTGLVRLHPATPVLAVYPGDRFGVIAANGRETYRIDADRLVVCTGAYEQIPLFEHNDLPGVFGLRALDRLVCGHGVVPAEPLAVVGDGDDALHLALRLCEAGVRLAGVVTGRRQDPALARLREAGVALFHDHDVLRARGGRWLDRLEFRSRDGDESGLLLDCQACALEAPASPAYELAHHAGCRVTFHSHSGYTIQAGADGRTSHASIFAAGHCAGAANVDEARRQGEAAGLACALSLQDDAEASARLEHLAPEAGN